MRTDKATGLRRDERIRAAARARRPRMRAHQAWILAANIATDLLAHLQFLGLDQHRELAAAEPETLRATILHIPARLTSHARARVLKVERTWPWAKAVVEAWERLGQIPAPP